MQSIELELSINLALKEYLHWLTEMAGVRVDN